MKQLIHIRNLTVLVIGLALWGCSESNTCEDCDAVSAKQTVEQSAKAPAEKAATEPTLTVDKLTRTQLKAPDFKSMTDVKEKKAAFFDYLYPLIKVANQEVRIERDKLESISEKESVAAKDIKLVETLCDKYRHDCGEAEPQQAAAQLASKIGVVPPSLAMGQAANESGWGTSRFALKGNNYFGQWCFTAGCGLVPAARSGSASHEVRTFDTPLDSVRSYVHNLNTSHAYKDLRKIRKDVRASDDPLTGSVLAPGLKKYSERGSEYVSEISSMIRTNELVEYDERFWQEILGDDHQG